MVKSPVGKDWVTNGGNLTNQRYSTLKQINTENVKQLKGAWMTRLKGSGIGGKYSAEATPLVKDGIMYVVTGNDDVFALNAKTGEILWERWSGIDQKISTVCCGWLNRGLAMGEGMLFLGQLDANVVALDIKTGKEVWKTPIEDWQNGYGVTSAPLYYDGIVYSGMTGGEFGVRGRLTALDAKTGKILWRSYTLPAPGEVGGDTWPAGTDARDARRRDRSGTRRRSIRELGLVYFATGNCGPDYDGSMREGDNLFCASIMAIDAKTGEYAWHFQQVHHDIWDYDAASPVVLFDTVINGQPRKATRRGRAHRLGLYSRPHQRQAADRHRGKAGAAGAAAEDGEDPAIFRSATPPCRNARSRCPGYRQGRLSLRAVLGHAGPHAAVGHRRHELVADAVQPGHRPALRGRHDPHQRLRPLRRRTGRTGMRYVGGTQAAPIGSPMSGTFTAINATTNKIAWQQQMPYRMGGGGGATVTAGGLLLRGEPDGNFVALRRQDRRGAVEVPDRLRRRCAADDL